MSPGLAACVVIFGLIPSLAVGQPAREAELRAALVADSTNLQRYLDLADYYIGRGQKEPAERTLVDALGVDPTARAVHERRVLLFRRPLEPRRVGRAALDWLSVDGTNLVPLLLVVGHRLRLASGLRGDGTHAAEDEIELALHDIDGALPSHPTAPELAVARMFLLEARAALTSDPGLAARSAAGAREIFEWAKQDPPTGWQTEPLPGELDSLVGVMLRRQMFGPRGAVRAGGRVPRPQLLHHVPIPVAAPARGKPRLLRLELVIDTGGRVVRVWPPDSADGYDEAIASAIRQWVFEPTRFSGEPVSVILDVTIPVR